MSLQVSRGKLGVAQTIRKDTRVHVDEFGTSGSYLFIAGLMETYYGIKGSSWSHYGLSCSTRN